MSYYIDANANQELAAKLLATNFAGTPLAGSPEDAENYASGLSIQGDKFTAADDMPRPDDYVSNGRNNVARYAIDGCTVFLETGENNSLAICPENTPLIAFFKDWDFGDVDRNVGLAEFGFNVCPEKAGENDTDVRVWVEPNYYASTIGAPTAHYARDDAYNELTFADYAAAQAWIDEREDGIYVTAHGEAGRPCYTIVK